MLFHTACVTVVRVIMQVSYLSSMDPCRTVVGACDERSVVSVVEVVDDSACDKGDKLPALQSAWRYCSPPNFAGFAKRRVSLPVEVLENYLYRQNVPCLKIRRLKIRIINLITNSKS